MSRRSRRVSGDTARTPAGAGGTVRTPSGATVASTIRGGTRSPLLATAWYMPAICSAVIERPWPMGRLPNVVPDQSSLAGTYPGSRPAARPGLLTEPETRQHVGEPLRGRPSAGVMIVPTFEDFASTP